MSWIMRLFRRPQPDPEPFDFENNPYKAKKAWPPDFKMLSAREQFRFEKKFRRRNKLAWTRPRWNKATKIVQWGIIIGYTYYVLFHYAPKDWDDGGEEPLHGFREWFRNAADELWTANSSMTKEDAARFRRRGQPTKGDVSNAPQE